MGRPKPPFGAHLFVYPKRMSFTDHRARKGGNETKEDMPGYRLPFEAAVGIVFVGMTSGQEGRRKTVSYQDGWAAIQLEMPSRIPHTEYSLESHWEVVRRSTGIYVTADSPEDRKREASLALMKAWNYDFRWATLVGNEVFGSLRTDMGHAEYQEGGKDRREAGKCPFTIPEEALALDFMESYGTIDQQSWARQFERDYLNRCVETPDMVNMTGIYITLVSGLVEIFGWEMLLLAAGSDPQAFGRLCDRYTDWILQYFLALAETRVPIVMVHDDMVWTSGPIFSPRWYRQFIFPNYRRLFSPLVEAGKKIMFTSDGNFTRFVDDIAACGVHGFVFEPYTDLAEIAEKYGKTHVIIGNADTRILLNGDRAAIRAEVQRCMRIGKSCPGYFLAVGNHIPANTPADNVLFYRDVYEELSCR